MMSKKGCLSSKCFSLSSLVLNVVAVILMLGAGIVLIVDSEFVLEQMTDLNKELLELEEIDGDTFDEIDNALDLMVDQKVTFAITIIAYSTLGLILYAIHFYALLKDRTFLMTLPLGYMMLNILAFFAAFSALFVWLLIAGGQKFVIIGLVITVVSFSILVVMWLGLRKRKGAVRAAQKWVVTDA